MATLGDNSVIGATVNADQLVNESIDSWATNYLNVCSNHAENLINTINYAWAGTAAQKFKQKLDQNYANLKKSISESATSMAESSVATRTGFTKLNENLNDQFSNLDFI